MNIKKVGANVLLIFISINMVVFGIEIGFQSGLINSGIADTETQTRWCTDSKERIHFHEEYGYTEVPNNKYITMKSPAQGWIYHSYNDRGFRDTYNSGDENIIVIGDSFTRGSLADDNATYPYLLDRWTPSVSFRNYGIGGYGTAHEYAVYQNVSNHHNHSVRPCLIA